MDVDVFLLWADGRDGRWELRDGQPVMMAPERAAHALTKFAAQKALENGIRARAPAVPRFPQRDDSPDRLGRRVRARRARRLPPPADLNTMEIPNPVVVVEVLSPSTAGTITG